MNFCLGLMGREISLVKFCWKMAEFFGLKSVMQKADSPAIWYRDLSRRNLIVSETVGSPEGDFSAYADSDWHLLGQ